MFACPDPWVSVALSVGWVPEWVLPLPVSFIFSLGENPSDEQPPTWKRELTGAARPPVDVSVPVTLIGSHDVGLSVKSGRSRSTSIRRIRSGIPSRIVGSGSDTSVTWAVVGSTYSAWRTTTVPRSSGPASTGTTTASPYGAPLYGPVRYASPDRKNGSGPLPAPVCTVPTCDPAGHDGFAA